MDRKIKIGIRYRLFMAFLIATICVVVSMFVVTRMSFERGVFRYVNHVERERLETLARILEQEYHEQGQWDALKESSEQWIELVASTRPQRVRRQEYRQFHDAALNSSKLANQEERLPPPVPRGAQAFDLRVVLLDVQKEVMQGPRPPWSQSPMFITLALDKEPIGYLGLIPPRILVDERIRQFSGEQHRHLVLIALSIAAGAALLALPLAGRMVRRITTLATATTQLAAGRYDIRVPAESSDELGQLARDFNSLATTLEQNEALRRRWVADISHELRTPLAILRGEVEAVQDGVRRLTPQTMDVLHSEILHLSRLVDDLYELSLADIGALTYHKESLDFGALVKQAVLAYREEWNEQGLSLTMDIPDRPLVLFADAERLHQLLGNLLQNTLRYTDSGGRLEVVVREETKNILLCIADSSPGVPEQFLHRLFDRLYRVEESRSRSHGGAGLGLALCKSIVEAHGGTIEAAPSPLGGLRITVTLPKKG
ncbi:ATP-binding protein [Desulfobulbus alkaliphilus]|uniref:ATP-binding protein n=1 Tax=Desulfobulbus alkaliphilus TaxID=869814 RepID=UPI0019652323|nr:ATP-binding protein [Desulfobulbus alkaliphilus]MBM9537129.1 HAMP domain-containing protein [Desulfobulbus alkaliphilus]